jgi:hypothetical protein
MKKTGSGDSKRTAMKFDGDYLAKPQIDLIPSEAIWAMAQVFGYGANKYERANYVDGIEWSRLYNACQRHLNAWNMGEDNDKDTNLSHIAHAMCNLAMLYWNLKHQPERDDRWNNGTKSKKTKR